MTTLSLLLSADVLAERGPLRLIPTTEDAKRYSLKLDPKVTIPLQERTYTSPIWYIS